MSLKEKKEEEVLLPEAAEEASKQRQNIAPSVTNINLVL
jgi:hypothetical protein